MQEETKKDIELYLENKYKKINAITKQNKTVKELGFDIFLIEKQNE